jgi:hypothetical protein
MSRLVSLAALIAALSAAAPAGAADWTDTEEWPEVEYGGCDSGGEDFSALRGGLNNEPKDWTGFGDQCDPMTFEFGTRYWYSWGAHRMTVIGDNYASDDTTHILEAHARIYDRTSNVYLKGLAGYSAVLQSNYSTPTGANSSMGGRVMYAGADVGYVPLGVDDSRFGGFIGYQYWNDSPDMGRVVFGNNSLPNDINYHVLRLGISGRADFGGFLDISAEVAAIPYATIWGTYGAFDAPGALGNQTSPGNVSGNLYGAAGEVMARVHPTENWTVGVGGRLWYLTGQADVTFSTDFGGGTNWITKTEQFSTLRYGLLGEITYRF